MWCYRQRFAALALSAACGIAAATLPGCDRGESVRAYRAPKEVVTSVPESPTAPAAAPADLTAVPAWTLPPGWKELPAQQMRYASLGVDPAHPEVVLTVVPLGAEAGGLGANVARWQGQLGSTPLSPSEAEKLVTHADVNGLHIDKVDLSGPAKDSAGAATGAQRMLAAVVAAGGRTWFFKLMGPAEVVAAQKSNFDAFMNSVRFVPAPTQSAEGGVAADAPPPAAPAAAAPSRAADGQAPNGISYDALPPGWTAVPGVQPPRVAAFKVEASGQQAELVVTKFPGTAIGTFADNVNRWRGQLGLPPAEDVTSYVPKPVTLGGEQWAIVDVPGEDKPGSPGSAQRILVGMATPGGAAAREIWFFKLQGPTKLVESQRPAFEKFLESLKFRNAE